MKNIAITGTSGVGKSYLEQVLKEQYGYMPLPKCVTRELRPSEQGSTDIVSLTQTKFVQMKENDEFFFTLEYMGNQYGWTRHDLHEINQSGKPATIAVTLESIEELGRSGEDFQYILLDLLPENFDLIINRMKNRAGYTNLSKQKRSEIDTEIEKRLALASKEAKIMDKYRSQIENLEGKVFEIKDDSTLFDVVIPSIIPNK